MNTIDDWEAAADANDRSYRDSKPEVANEVDRWLDLIEANDPRARVGPVLRGAGPDKVTTWNIVFRVRGHEQPYRLTWHEDVPGSVTIDDLGEAAV